MMDKVYEILLVLLLVFLSWAATYPAHAHKAPSGMEYDPTCCNENDCAVVTKEVKTPLGVTYYTKLHPEGVHFTFKEISTQMRDGVMFRVKYSDDSFVHVCADQIGDIYRNADGEYYDKETGEQKINGEVQFYVYCLYLPAGV